MTESTNPEEDPAVVGVPDETPDAVRPSATGVVVGPLDEAPDIVVADVARGAGRDTEAVRADDDAVAQTLEDAEGGVEGSLLDAPDAE
jgi:hypothetical protein